MDGHIVWTALLHGGLVFIAMTCAWLQFCWYDGALCEQVNECCASVWVLLCCSLVDWAVNHWEHCRKCAEWRPPKGFTCTPGLDSSAYIWTGLSVHHLSADLDSSGYILDRLYLPVLYLPVHISYLPFFMWENWVARYIFLKIPHPYAQFSSLLKENSSS